MKIKYFYFLFFFCQTSFSQVGGEEIYQFLNLTTSARQVALGGEVLTLLDDVSQPIWNPAIISEKLDNQLAVNYSSYLGEINIGSASYARLINRRFGVIHGSIKYLNYGSIIEADEQGNELGTFNASDLAISLGYALNIPNSDFYFGANAKLITANISTFTSVGVAFDLGLLFSSEYYPFEIALVARNIGTQVKSFNGTTERLPFKVSLGGSYKLQYIPLKWYFTLDNLQKWDLSVPNPSNQTVDLEGVVTQEEVSFIGNMFRHFVIGAELFPESAINLRVGYNFRRARELALQNARSFSGISFGFGLKMNKLKFNYAYSSYHSATNTSTFSLQIDLNNNWR